MDMLIDDREGNSYDEQQANGTNANTAGIHPRRGKQGSVQESGVRLWTMHMANAGAGASHSAAGRIGIPNKY